MSGTRRFARYAANLRLRLQFATGELETTTEEISLAGFSAPCADLPEVGTTFGFTVHLPDGTLVTGTAAAMRISPDGLAGFSCEFAPAQQALWEAFVQQEKAAGGVWRMIARYALTGGQQHEAARSVLEKGRFGILFKRLGEKKPDAEDPPVVMRLHMVGENGEAYRLAFEKHGGDKPEASPFVAATPHFVDLARKAIARVLGQDVFLKRSPQAEVTPVRLVELLKGGYGHVVLHPTAKPSLMGLHGSELMAVEVDGKSVFPFFTAGELELIAHDTFRLDVDAPADSGPAQVREERAAAYAHKEVDTQAPAASTQVELLDAMAASQRAQTRTYGDRALKLFPDVWLEVRRAGAPPARGFAMEDGPALCVFVTDGPGAPRVARLEPTDVISIIRGGREA